MQILYDFAGYCHMAIGLSLMLGVELSENFLAPYRARDIQDFWRRWHVTLSNWFRDYLYIPLGGSRRGLPRTVINVMVTFSLCGLWHGAGWNFMAWGAFHGLLLAWFHVRRTRWPEFRPPVLLSVAGTFILVHFAWVLFRVHQPALIFSVWRGMIGLSGWNPGPVAVPDACFLIGVTALTLAVPCASRRWPGSAGGLESVAWWAAALFAVFGSPQIQQFIYFAF